MRKLYFEKLKSLFESPTLFFILLILYKIILEDIFSKVIVPIYGEIYKYTYAPTVFSLIVSWIIFLAFALITRYCYYAESGVSNAVLFLLFLFSIIPFTVMLGGRQFSVDYCFANTIYFVVLYFFVFIFSRKLKLHLPKLKQCISPRKKIYMLTGFLFCVAMFVCGRYSHFRINFNIDLVYDLRSMAQGYKLPTILVYFFGWACWLTPFLIAYYIRIKKHSVVLILFVSQIFMFGYDGMKGPFFFCIVVLIINYLLPMIKMSSLNTGILYGLTGGVFLTFLLYKVAGIYVFAQLFINRLGMITNQISYAYYCFFTENQPDYFRGSFLRYFGARSPYGNIPYMISEWFFGIDSGANDGLIADSMTNMGYVGIIIMPAIIAFILVLLDLNTKNIDRRVSICVALYMTLMLMSMFIFPILLTGGLIVLFFLLNWINEECSKGGGNHYANHM